MRRFVPFAGARSRTTDAVDLLVLAKEPVAGRVKTRLIPPCTAAEAATLAAAALADTFAIALATGVDRVIAVLDGRPGEWLPPGVVVRAQGGGSFNERLARAWGGVTAPAVQIGMDTPQLDVPTLVDACGATLAFGAAFGPARDGGWWCLGMRVPRTDVFEGVRPSTPHTGREQLARLRTLGIEPWILPVVRDVDTWSDALAVATQFPDTRFAAAVDTIAGVRA
jgi:glycosyltransferase A (GT-A) superfamily protein (DUF2064 family)